MHEWYVILKSLIIKFNEMIRSRNQYWKSFRFYPFPDLIQLACKAWIDYKAKGK